MNAPERLPRDDLPAMPDTCRTCAAPRVNATGRSPRAEKLPLLFISKQTNWLVAAIIFLLAGAGLWFARLPLQAPQKAAEQQSVQGNNERRKAELAYGRKNSIAVKYRDPLQEELVATATSVSGPAPAGSAAGAQHTPLLPERFTASKEDKWISTALASLSPGRIAFNLPEQMWLGHAERVEIRIAKSQLADAIFQEGLKGHGALKIENIKVGAFMKVQLCCGPRQQSHPFDIVPLNNLEQVVGGDTPTQWSFDVTPKKLGQQKLTLQVTVRLQLPSGRQEQKDFKLREQVIGVRVSVSGLLDWLFAHWQWVMSAIILPLAAVAWGYTRKSRNSKLSKSKTPNKNAVFISYRRTDSRWFSHSLNNALSAAFGEQRVFIDIEDIDPGLDFSQVIDGTLQECEVLLAVIGNGWLAAANAAGRRLDEPGDYVRIEIETALQRNVRVIPTLIDGAPMPAVHELPEALKKLAQCNAVVFNFANFDACASRLIDALKPVINRGQTQTA